MAEKQDEQQTQGYWLETNEAESQRLFVQHRYFTAALGRLLPKSVPVGEVRTVLDVGCGPGGWALDLIEEYPHMTVIGIDISTSALAEAARYAQLKAITTASFQQMDATKPLDFKDGSFDLVHMRSASSFIRPKMWSAVIAELVRVLRPGGWLVVIDYEQGPTSSPAFNRIGELVMKALRAANMTLAPSSATIGAAVRLYGFLLNAYLQDVSYSIHSVDFGGRDPDTSLFIDELLVGSANIKPFLLRLGLIESEAFDALMGCAHRELHQPDACGYAFLVAVTGRKNG